MPDITLKPIILNDITLNLDADGYAANVNRAVLTPTTATVKWKGMKKGSQKTLAADTEWTLELQFAQDHETAKSLSLITFDKAGLEVPFTLKPQAGAGSTYGGKITLVPTSIGGDIDQVGVASASFAVNGALTRTPAAP